MNGQKFSGLESDFIRKYLSEEKREIEISEFYENSPENFEKSATPVKFLTDFQKQKECAEDRLLKLLDCKEENDVRLSLAPLFGKKVLVSFYFNSLGLCFVSEIVMRGSSVFIVLPENFYSVEAKKRIAGKFSAVLFYDCGALGKNSGEKYIPISCDFDERFSLFERPGFCSSDEAINSRIKNWIAKLFSEDGKDSSFFGNGLFLISAGKYLFQEKKSSVESVKCRKKSPAIIYLDDERILFAAEKEDMVLTDGKSYRLSFSFPLPPPLKKRVIDLTCFVRDIFSNSEGTRLCALSFISEIKEEDRRFLGEMAKC